MKLILKNKDYLFVVSSIILFIVVRSIYFHNLFVFVYDQVASSTVVLELWKNKEISLIGPPMSLTIENRQIYFGGVSYLMQLVFLIVGNFDPFWSTYAFMFFASLMIVPLYFGMKRLVNTQAAVAMTFIYTLMPFYIQGTYQLWNPYFQLTLLPPLIYLMSKFKEKETSFTFFLIGVLSGILFQLHYQFLIVFLGIFFYYFIVKKLNKKFLFIGGTGFVIGVINMILFELRNDFYTFRTLVIFQQNFDKVLAHPQSDYYAMSIFFFLLIIIFHYFKKYITLKVNLLLFLILLIMAYQYVVVAAPNRNYPENWYYEDELAIYEIIKENYYENNIKDFNIFEFYTATGTLPKYFMKRDGLSINFDDYYNNKYLYVVYHKDNNYMEDVAYEVNQFKPNRVVETWEINNDYNLYLLERVNNAS